MENELHEDERVPFGVLTSISFTISNKEDTESRSVMSIELSNEVTDPRLGLPNPSSSCSTCGANDSKSCEGHFGHIKLPFTVLNPYFVSEVVQVLNKICPGCKSIRQDLRVKGNSLEWYPKTKFKVSSNEYDHLKKSAIIAEVNESTVTLQNKRPKRVLPADYWEFLPKDELLDESCIRPNRRVLSHAQVHYLLKDVDPEFIKKFVPRTDLLFLNCFPVTPNCHRVTEFHHAFSNGQRLKYLHSEKLSSKEVLFAQQKTNEGPSNTSGSRWVKEVVLGKRSDHCLRMVVVGDPNIRLNEIGIPARIAERMHISVVLNKLNLEKSDACRDMRVTEQGIYIHRDSHIVRVRPTDFLKIGDTIYRPLSDGDLVLINRPPSIHQHSHVAFSVKVLPTGSALSLNPLCCSPFRADFDGDCLHGYIPQSVASRVELKELVSLDKQLLNGQSGKNLISLSQDSLTAAHLMLEDSVTINRFQMQQLQMFISHHPLSPAIIKAPSLSTPVWTGKQVFSMLLPEGFDYVFSSANVYIKNGELISAEGSSWLRDTDNIFQSLAKNFPDKVLDILFAAQEILCEWLSTRGLSVSLLDLNLSSDPSSWKNMKDEIFYGLQEAEQACMFKQLLNTCWDFLTEDSMEDLSPISLQVEKLSHDKQRSAVLSQASIDAFKKVFRDIQTLAFRYACEDNSLLTMLKAGSKGNLLKLVQHSMCLGLQHSLVPLSFGFPHLLSCAAWNEHKVSCLIQEDADAPKSAKSYIPYAVVGNSFLTGLNPLESFVHSVTSRESSFSDNAELPGTLHRRLMYFMRDLYIAYDGTIRNSYGSHVVQFYYGTDEGTSEIAGQPVGSLSACAISEAAYSALDQPISLLETSPLLNLKNALECGSKKRQGGQTMLLYLSRRLGRQRHGYEYAALEVKNYLEALMFSDIVSTVMITFTSQAGSQKSQKSFSPWEILRRRRLTVQSVINSLYERHSTSRKGSKVKLPNLRIRSKDCSVPATREEDNDTCCITVSIECSKNSVIQLITVQDLLIPFLLETIVKGFREIEKVDILWSDRSNTSKATRDSSGELYLKVSMSGDSGVKSYWSTLMNDCLRIMDLIDWSRSHPENVNEFCSVYGIDSGWKFFLNNLESAVSDVGKTILPEHLLLVANTLSVTGNFVGLTPKGLARQREHASVATPFSQACFSNPAACFIKAAKAEVTDGLHGTLDALAWGNIPPLGTGGQFELVFSGKGHEVDKPINVYDMLATGISPDVQGVNETPDAKNHRSVKFGALLLYDKSVSQGLKKLGISKDRIKKLFKLDDIWILSNALAKILNKYPINQSLDHKDKSTLMIALYFHPRIDEKIGTGFQDIKVAYHPKHQSSRCFVLVRADGTVEDFSYRKCVLGALEIIDPQAAEIYKSNMRYDGNDQVRVDIPSRPRM
ncbi:DNA-directed RNA polymerase D subunit 1 [Morus notabilis]|uniref:DNA-directed RNA polymerase subunit n=1 Tax=Morus notabilis TaxID=981085 RepID=W9SMV3_9ROSA|nr:DNA-directed RNA polymerase D subunit 1 [Morus notabilis]